MGVVCLKLYIVFGLLAFVVCGHAHIGCRINTPLKLRELEYPRRLSCKSHKRYSGGQTDSYLLIGDIGQRQPCFGFMGPGNAAPWRRSCNKREPQEQDEIRKTRYKAGGI